MLVPKSPNYGFEKRRKEQDRKRKKEEKRQRKLEESKRREAEPQLPPPDETAAIPQQ
jgi:hypothetical protein